MTNKEPKKAIIAILNKNFTGEWVVTPVYTTNDGKEIELPQELCEIFNDIVVQAVIPYFADALITAGYGDTKATAKEAVTGFQANLTKWLAKQYRESSTVEITTVFNKIEELLEETK